jgi:hypothetical protein
MTTMATITCVSNKMIIIPVFIDDYGETIGIRLTFVNILSNMILRQRFYKYPNMWLRITYSDGTVMNEQQLEYKPYSAVGFDFQFYKDVYKVYVILKEEVDSDVDSIIGISGEENEITLIKQEMDFRGTIPVFVADDAHWHLGVGSWRELAVKSNNPSIDFIPKMIIHVNHHMYYDCILRQIDKYMNKYGSEYNEDELIKGCRAKLLTEWFDSLKDIYRRHVYESYPILVYGKPHISSKVKSHHSLVLDVLEQLEEEMFSKDLNNLISFENICLKPLKWEDHSQLKELIKSSLEELNEIENSSDTVILCLNKGVFDIGKVFTAYDFYDDLFNILLKDKTIRKLILISSDRGNGVKYIMSKGEKIIEVVKTSCMTARVSKNKHTVKMDNDWLLTDKFDISTSLSKGNGYEFFMDNQIRTSNKRILKNEIIGKINNAIKLRKNK